jgi:general secretion pathway protein A
MIDEAQNLSFDLLEQVRLLTNLETTHNKLLQVILVGQSELKDHIEQINLRQLSQRISARYHLDPLTADETKQYIAHRISIVGLPESLFSAGALSLIYKNSRGIPRLINSICDRCLLGAYVAGKRVISRRLALNAAREVLGASATSHHKLSPIALTAVTIVTIMVMVYGMVGWMNGQLPFGFNMDRITGWYASPVPANVGQADKSGQPSTRLYAALEPDDTHDTAFGNMIALWNTAKSLQGMATSCQDTTQMGLACLNWAEDWNAIRQLNRPFMIELTTPQGTTHTVLVRTLQDGSATLDLSTRQIQVPEDILRSLKPDKFLLLWQPPPFYSRTLRPDMTGNDVAWVRKRLNKANLTLPTAVNNPGYYDDSLLAEVNSFKRRHHRPGDGLIDPATLILMDNTLGDVIVPVLYENP